MKRSIVSIILMVLTAVSVASLLTRRANASIVVMTAQLLASNEVPPVTNADVNANGSVTVTLDTVANTAQFVWSLSNLGASSIILSHIHEGPAGVNGPIRVDSGISPATAIPVVNGLAGFSRSGLTVPADVMQRLLAGPSGFYFNVHSNLNPGGVARGQLVVATQGGGTAAPTLSEWGAILMTLLFIAAGTFFLVGRSKAGSLAAAQAPAMLTGHGKAIDWKLLQKVTLFVEAAIVLALIALRASPVDVMGAVTAGLVLSFVLHLLIGRARRT
ncbi:MAG TPA: CHRD domain-containing protein [Blastocatellia bacterium]|nr:CHRD domain-containing protein [Blastocatellia bacterium]